MMHNTDNCFRGMHLGSGFNSHLTFLFYSLDVQVDVQRVDFSYAIEVYHVAVLDFDLLPMYLTSCSCQGMENNNNNNNNNEL